MPKRERGSGGLLKVKGSRFYYGQYYKDGRQIRVSLKTDVKTKAQASLRWLMGRGTNDKILFVVIRRPSFHRLGKDFNRG